MTILEQSQLPEFPETLPTQSLAELIKILRSGEIIKRRAEFSWHEWLIQGWLSRTLFGTPDAPKPGDGSIMVVLSEDDASELFQFATDLQGMTGQSSALEGIHAGPIGSLLAAKLFDVLLSLLKRVIEELLDELQS